MSAAQRSISQRLTKAKSAEAKAATAHSWATEWMSEQDGLLRELRSAVERDDRQRMLSVVDGLQAMSSKRHGALHKVLDALLLFEAGDGA
ncbi:hypothetical protein [Acidovorax sp. BLS4]|uniref:hypothetical protein n=1 Tax=Acidovorax sp. BLS4 TaxID=3273430 RepID=UPI0029423453|nr:hypothetical protein [Paracidovorax avenae]WOI43803.1 hypothetical protein R1Z03_14785 [Paracidovorax avenae]